MTLIGRTLFLLILFAALLYSAPSVCGQTPITTINTNAVTTGLTTSSYVATSPSDAGGSVDANTAYTVNFGRVQNLLPLSYVAGGITYDRFVNPDTLIIRRTDASRRLILFYAYDNVNNTTDVITIEAEQQSNEEATYESRLINAGYDNILVNDATNFANIERIDIVYYSGVFTSSPSTAVFPIVERGGNDDIKVAAIKALDASGNPSEYYSTVVQVNNNGTSEWGDTGISIESLVMRRQDANSNPLPQGTLGSQNIHGSVVSFTDFGIAANEIVYGYSIFADDVDESSIDITDISEYPTNTGSNSGIDLIAGISTAVASDDNLVKTVGPGGYKSALNTWLKANVGVTTATDGSTVTDWQDQWLGNHDATTLATAPTYRDGTASAINFNPTVDFVDGDERGLLIANNSDFNTATSYTTKAINLAFRTGDDIATKQQIYEQGSNNRGVNVYIRNNEIYVGAWNITSDGAGSPWGFFSVNTSALTGAREISTDTEYIITLEYSGNTATTGALVAYLNGQSFGTISNVGLLFSDTDGIGLGDVNSQSRYDDGTTGAASFYGSIAELVYCNLPGSFSSAQRNRIESYLALKYGITLDQSTALSYVNAEGTIIFNTAISRTIGGYLQYNADIAGIGRDDDSEFEQRVSRSENVGSIVTIARNTEIGTDETFLIWGNDKGALTTVRTEVPDAIFERLERVWRVSESNELGQTDISFDLNSLGLGTDPNDFALVIGGASSLGDLSSGTVVSGGTFSGDVITFANVNLANGQYFTLGTQFFICTPGNVPDGLALWLKAGAETFNTGTTLATNGQTVDTWADQGRNGFDATIGTNRAPTWVENSVNFNPGLNWNAGTNTIGYTLGSNYIFADDSDGGLHIFSAIAPIDVGDDNNTRQQKMIYSFGDRTARNVGFGSSDQRGTMQYPGSNSNFSVSPTAASFTVEADYDISAGPSDVESFILDGEVITTSTVSFQLDNANIDEASTHGSNQGPVSIGRQSEENALDNNNGRRFFGDMGEVIVYNAEISDLQAQQVRSYLALKYGSILSANNDDDGTTNEIISGAIREGDYVASNGTTISWAYNDDTGFVSNVAGIGRDDDTCLNQKQSRSVNSGAILIVGLGEIAATNAANANSFAADNSFLTWATDGAGTAFANITTAGTPGTVTERILRVWRAQDTGDVGATDISFDLTGLTGYSTDAADYQLIIASGGDNTSLENGNTTIGATFNGTVLTFSDINLTDGQYFTLGVASEQCSPGGVPTTNLQIWLRADLGTNSTTNAVDITSWSDQSGNSNNATASNAPVYNTNNHNFNPSIDFTVGNSDNMTIVDGTNDSPDQQAVFLVGTMSSSTSAWSPFLMKAASFDWPNGWGLARNSSSAEVFFHKDSYAANNNGADYASRTITYDEPTIHVAFKDATNYNYNLNLGTVDTDLPGSGYLPSNNITFLGATPNGTGTTNSTTPTSFLDGSISEVIMFDNALNATQRQQIATYLAIKYGITLNQTPATNYLFSDGTTVLWNATTNSSYNQDIAGIGRDDASCFAQKQSSSINADDILTIGLGTIAATNSANLNAFDQNGDYLIWGNDGNATLETGAINSTDGGTPDLPSTIAQRMERVWRVDDTGAVGETEIQFDLAGLGYTSVAGNFSLIVSNSPTMASGSLVTGGTFTGNVLSFSGINLTDGQYFTLATENETCGPGGVNTNLELWLKADAGTNTTTDGADLATWADQSNNGNNAAETDFGGGAVVEPTYESNEINGNPVVRFTDTNTTNSSWMETADGTNTTSGDLSMVAVYKSTQNQGSISNFQDAPALIGANSGGNNDYGLGMAEGRVHVNAANNSGLNARDPNQTDNFEPYIASATRDIDSPFNLELYINSANVASATSDNTALSGPNSWAIGNHSTPDNEAQFQGDIAEAIVFSSTLTDEERTRVETYLAIKYGITRTVASLPGAEQDYLAGDGGVIWGYDEQGTTYHNDIAGIGRDDISCFSQLSSKSENDDALVTMSIGSFPDNDSFIIWGNDNAAIEDRTNRDMPATINSRLNREWRVQETGTVGNVTLRFDLSTITGPGDVVGANNRNQLRLLVDNDGIFDTDAMLIEPTSIDAVNNTVTFTVNFNTGQYFTLGSEEVGALPVTLISFSAETIDSGAVKIKWQTAQETNNAFYTIERSIDGLDFEKIANVQGAGTSLDFASYSYLDQSPMAGISFYRLKQTDFSGEFEYSELVRVFVEKVTELKTEFKVNPNPTALGKAVKLFYKIGYDQDIEIQVLSSDGVILVRKRLRINASSTFTELAPKNFHLGLNLIRIVDGRGSLTIIKVLIK